MVLATAEAIKTNANGDRVAPCCSVISSSSPCHCLIVLNRERLPADAVLDPPWLLQCRALVAAHGASGVAPASITRAVRTPPQEKRRRIRAPRRPSKNKTPGRAGDQGG